MSDPERDFVSATDEPGKYNHLVADKRRPSAWKFRYRPDGPLAGWGVTLEWADWLAQAEVEVVPLYEEVARK